MAAPRDEKLARPLRSGPVRTSGVPDDQGAVRLDAPAGGRACGELFGPCRPRQCPTSAHWPPPQDFCRQRRCRYVNEPPHPLTGTAGRKRAPDARSISGSPRKHRRFRPSRSPRDMSAKHRGYPPARQVRGARADRQRHSPDTSKCHDAPADRGTDAFIPPGMNAKIRNRPRHVPRRGPPRLCLSR